MLSSLSKSNYRFKIEFSEDFTTGCTMKSSETSLSMSSQECKYSTTKKRMPSVSSSSFHLHVDIIISMTDYFYTMSII